MLWERAAQGAFANADWAVAIGHADRARDYHLQRGQARAAARAQAIAGQALRNWGRHAEARDQLTSALEVLRADPDSDTVRALDELAVAGGVRRLARRGQAHYRGTHPRPGRWAPAPASSPACSPTRGIYLSSAERRPEAVAYLREAARLAEEAGDNFRMGRALLNLSDALTVTDPAAAAEAARTAAGHLRRAGARDYLAYAITNLVQALLMLGDWDAAEQELTQAVDSDGLADHEHLACYRGWLAALRGDAATAQTMLAALPDLRASEDPQDKAQISLAEAFTAAARGHQQDALRHARATLAQAGALGISHEFHAGRGRWPPAPPTTCGTPLPPASCSPCSTTTSPGTWPPCCAPNATWPAPASPPARRPGRRRVLRRRGQRPARAEHPLPPRPRPARPRRVPHPPGTTPRQPRRPIGEARDIAGRLRCQPLLDRAADMTAAEPRIQA